MTERTADVRARTVQGFCRAYGIGRTAAYELIGEGRLQAKKFGKRTLIMEDSAKAWFGSLAAKEQRPNRRKIRPISRPILGSPTVGDHERPKTDGRDGK